ncbi:hypothetical protein QBC47DRAFT_377684 [Echria macrotheca]|uniref:Uncharacterized protein n=1 Tax=Echria macrotheca TaxID=438768 RepID=A0AAJ0F6F7_9PEZI|nr:hypothetical protein QBC47DRAFT_377684 [Echria macrotheca]
MCGEHGKLERNIAPPPSRDATIRQLCLDEWARRHVPLLAPSADYLPDHIARPPECQHAARASTTWILSLACSGQTLQLPKAVGSAANDQLHLLSSVPFRRSTAGKAYHVKSGYMDINCWLAKFPVGITAVNKVILSLAVRGMPVAGPWSMAGETHQRMLLACDVEWLCRKRKTVGGMAAIMCTSRQRSHLCGGAAATQHRPSLCYFGRRCGPFMVVVMPRSIPSHRHSKNGSLSASVWADGDAC